MVHNDLLDPIKERFYINTISSAADTRILLVLVTSVIYYLKLIDQYFVIQ